MAKAQSAKPLISGGRTLSKMVSGTKSSGHPRAKKKLVWRQLNGKKYATYDIGPSGHQSYNR